MNINWFALTIMFIWLSAAIGTKFSKDDGPFEAAFFITIIMGFGYVVMHR